MTYVPFDAAEAAELAEMLEYIVECLDTLALVDVTSERCDDWWPSYDLDQLRGDLGRFIALIRDAGAS